MDKLEDSIKTSIAEELTNTTSDYIQTEGEVLQALPNAIFRVKIGEYVILCHVSGKIRKHSINIIPGDTVAVDIPVADPTKGRITFRSRKKKWETQEK